MAAGGPDPQSVGPAHDVECRQDLTPVAHDHARPEIERDEVLGFRRQAEPGFEATRLGEQGRALPDGLHHVESWVEANFDRCFQLMECDDVTLLQKWILQWRDLMEFEIVPVSPSKAVRELFPGG